MKKTKSFIFLAGTIFVIMLVMMQTACKKDDKKDTTDLSISLKSSNVLRATYDQVNIDIQSASIHTSANPDETGGWVDIPTNTGQYNLLDYEAGNDTIFALAPALEVQTVSQIRLILGTDNTIVVDGITYDLDTPSAQTSGWKILIHAELQANVVYKVVLNFDVDKSIVVTGNNKYKLSPVVNATLVQM